MKITHPDITQPILFEEGLFPSLVIENPKLFYKFIDDIYRQTCGEYGLTILSNNDTPLSISKNVDLITNYFPFDINTKTLLNKVISELEKQATSDTYWERTKNIVSDVERWVLDLAYSSQIEIEVPRLSAGSLLKSSGLTIKDDFESLPEKLLTYMDLMSNYNLANVFIFVNLRSLLDVKTLEFFTDCSCKHCFKFLLVDNHSIGKLSREKKIVIDEDLCEI